MFKVVDSRTNLVIACFDQEKQAISYANQQNGIANYTGDNARYEVVGKSKNGSQNN